MRRRTLLRAGASLPLLATRVRQAKAADVAAGPTPFAADTVTALARSLAGQPFKAADSALPKELADLDFQGYQSIRFDPAHALWSGQGLNFTAQFAPRGFLFKDRVDIFEVADGQASPVRYSPDQFSWEKLAPPVGDLGFAGLRVQYPLNRLGQFDEIFAFLGASYFRAVARGQGYGLSARGLAIKTADRSGEEFPFFRSFWLERPAQGAHAITVHALLDSPSAAAAFRFIVAPGQVTVFDTEATIFPRVDITLSGLAPMTSMFFFDADDRDGIDDWRAAVHDSDSLVLRTGHDERILRPLSNPRTLQISTFSDSGPRGYGLTQRRRDFADYQDLEGRYERRPSLWVEPVGDWGQGVVELVEIPSGQESNDNIVAFWRPHDPLKAKSEVKLAYRLFWGASEPEPGPVARVVQTRSGASADGKHRQFIIDFVGAPLDPFTAQSPPALDVGTDKGKIVSVVAEPNPDIKGWRISIELDTEGQPVVEMHARLMRDNTPLSETWIARWTPS